MKKRHSLEQIVGMLRQADVLLGDDIVGTLLNDTLTASEC